MRIGLSSKEIGAILGIHPSRAGQAIDPALHKIGRLFRVYPVETMRMILHAAEVMSEAEIDLRSRMASI